MREKMKRVTASQCLHNNLQWLSISKPIHLARFDSITWIAFVTRQHGFASCSSESSIPYPPDHVAQRIGRLQRGSIVFHQCAVPGFMFSSFLRPLYCYHNVLACNFIFYLHLAASFCVCRIDYNPSGKSRASMTAHFSSTSPARKTNSSSSLHWPLLQLIRTTLLLLSSEVHTKHCMKNSLFITSSVNRQLAMLHPPLCTDAQHG